MVEFNIIGITPSTRTLFQSNGHPTCRRDAWNCRARREAHHNCRANRRSHNVQPYRRMVEFNIIGITPSTRTLFQSNGHTTCRRDVWNWRARRGAHHYCRENCRSHIVQPYRRVVESNIIGISPSTQTFFQSTGRTTCHRDARSRRAHCRARLGRGAHHGRRTNCRSHNVRLYWCMAEFKVIGIAPSTQNCFLTKRR